MERARKEDEGTTSSNPSARQRTQSRSGRNSFFILPLTTPYMPRGSSFDRGSMASPSTAPTAASSALRTAAAALGRPRKTVTALATTRPFATPDQHGSGGSQRHDGNGLSWTTLPPSRPRSAYSFSRSRRGLRARSRFSTPSSHGPSATGRSSQGGASCLTAAPLRRASPSPDPEQGRHHPARKSKLAEPLGSLRDAAPCWISQLLCRLRATPTSADQSGD